MEVSDGLAWIPGPISVVDCFFFCYFVALRLLQDVGLAVILLSLFNAASFFSVELPHHFYRALRARHGFGGAVDDFSRTAPLFEVLVIRCMRYAFAQLPNNVIKTFFHRDVALRFTEYRYRAKPERKDWEEVEENGVRGIWIKKHQDREPDFVLYYIHGGGYVYGSVWFYLQWLHAFHTTLCPYFNNPAIFALSYSPAPQSTYPTQVKEACNGYAYALKAILDDAGKLCLAGDSAGAALAMMVVHKLMLEGSQKLPKQVLLISPWLSLNPTLAFVTDSDFVTTAGLRACAKAYAPSPEYGTNEDASVMRRLSSHWPERSNLLGDQLPRPIFHVWYGKNETVHDEIEAACHILQLKGWEVRRILEGAPDKAIHVWPVASFFLGRDQGRRLESLKKLSAKLR